MVLIHFKALFNMMTDLQSAIIGIIYIMENKGGRQDHFSRILWSYVGLYTGIHLLWLIQSIIEMHDKHFLNLHDSLNIACSWNLFGS